MQDFRNLQVWTKAHEMTLHAYRSTKSFPKEEMFGPDEPDPARLRLDWRKYRRRLWTERQS